MSFCAQDLDPCAYSRLYLSWHMRKEESKVFTVVFEIAGLNQVFFPRLKSFRDISPGTMFGNKLVIKKVPLRNFSLLRRVVS